MLTEIVGSPEVAARYAELPALRLPSYVPVPGLTGFLEAVPAVRYVASSAPVGEIDAQLGRHRLGDFFARVLGHPVTRTEALRLIGRRHAGQRIVFIGDAPADLAAARATGADFIALNPNAGLAGAF